MDADRRYPKLDAVKRFFAIAIEAVVMGGPISFIAMLILFPMLFAPFVLGFSLDWGGVSSYVLLLGIFWALSEYWHIAYATAIDASYKFGVRFWSAILGSLGALYVFFVELELYRDALICLPVVSIVASTSHFVYLQIKKGNRLRAVPASDRGS